MSTRVRRLGLGSLVLLGLLAVGNRAPAQFGVGNPNVNNPFLQQRQFLFNLQLQRAAFANSMGGANPALALPSNVPPFNPFLAFGANPYSPLAPDYAATTATNPYNPSAADPYMSNPYGGFFGQTNMGPGYALMGAADVMRAYGNVVQSLEQSRIIREQYYQTRLDTTKRRFDLDMYIKANTPTFTEEQAKITRQTLRRIQTTSSPAEISTGKSLNFLLDDIRRYRGREFAMATIPLDDHVLKHLNVTDRNRSLGLLRDGGKLVWPTAVAGLTTDNQRRELEARAQAIVQDASRGKRDPNALKDVRNEIDQVRERLRKKANEINSGPYLEGMRFLNDFEDATIALEQGEAASQFEFQKMMADGRVRNINDLVNVMVDRGWRFAPALQTDEGAYRALHSALVAYDLALNSHVAAAETKE